MDEAEAKREIDDIMTNPKNKWHDRWRAGNKEAKEHMDKLWQQITNGE